MMIRRDIFADTSGWGHLVDAAQEYNNLASTIYQEARQQGYKFITTNYVIAELVALLTRPFRAPRPAIVAFVDSIKASPSVEIIYVDQALDEQAWQLLKQRADKEWSLVDCTSFVIMQQLGVREALTTDHHFEQAGFICLLKS